MLIKGSNNEMQIKCDKAECANIWSPNVGPEGTIAGDALKCPKCKSPTSLNPGD